MDTTLPSRKELLLARLRFIRRDLDEVVGRLTDDLIRWAPGEGVRPLFDQLLEIGMNEVMSVAILRDGVSLSHADAEATLVHDRSVASFAKMLSDVRQSTLDYIDTLSEEELAEFVDASNPWFASFGLAQVPRYDALLSISFHEHYHVGQLITSLWVSGDDPYRW
jgi:DinB superfamily